MLSRLRLILMLAGWLFLVSHLSLVALAQSPIEAGGDLPGEPEGISIAAGGSTYITVTTTDDELNSDSDCSLREAIQAANSNAPVSGCSAGSDSDIVVVPTGSYSLTLSGTPENSNQNGDLDITSTLTISGSGAGSTLIKSNGTDRIFDISGSGVVTVSGVTVTNGGSVDKGGGIRNQGLLTLKDCAVTGNTAVKAGGGIVNQSGRVMVDNCIISHNSAGTSSTAADVGGGVSNEAGPAGNATFIVNHSQVISNVVRGVGGGGINNSADTNMTAVFSLNQTLVSHNLATATTVISTAGYGGGIRNSYIDRSSINATTILTVNNSTVSHNRAFNAGGIGNGADIPTGSASAMVNKSTISDNHVDGVGAMLGNGGGLVNVNGTMMLVNSTLSGNTTTGSGSPLSGLGGNVINSAMDMGSLLWLTNTTVSGNVTPGGGVANISFNYGVLNATVSFKNSIIATNCLNILGTFSSKGHNLENGHSCNLTATTDITDTDPLLAPLADNGGDTHTHALLSDSPAIGQADAVTCAASPINGVDQRGVIRGPTSCDIGAFETRAIQPEPGATQLYLPIVVKAS